MNDMTRDQQTVRLSNATLADLPDGIARPSYDRSKLTPGIVHIGLGNFHRAHQAWYLHRLMQQGDALDWAIIGAGVRPPDSAMRDKLLTQDCLNTLIELDPSGMSAEVTGAMIDFLPVEPDNASLIAELSKPAIRIVSLTVTEGGYYQTPTGALDTDHADIQHDAAHPDRPKTAFGAIVAALKNRRAAGHPPFTGQCCDNLRHNGDILAQTVIGLARMSDPTLADWIAANSTFPNAMVDCIVPATGPNELALVQNLGIDDAAPVTHENFRQWVIEDKFAAGRPPWEKVGATLTDNVHVYEAMKIRVLNAGHQVVANAGELLSCPTIASTMQDPDIAAFFRKVETDEITPYVAPVPGMTPAAYLDLIVDRFANPEIHDTTRRVAYDGTARHPGFLHPILNDALAADGGIDGLALTQALWCHMCAGTRDDGSQIEPNDPNWDALTKVAQAAKTDPALWLAQETIYGDLADNDRFAKAFAHWLTRLTKNGTRATLQAYLAG
jgi:mannitol 2-dehydrogenase